MAKVPLPTGCWNFTHTIGERDMQAQVLDDMDLERDKGITIVKRFNNRNILSL